MAVSLPGSPVCSVIGSFFLLSSLSREQLTVRFPRSPAAWGSR
jgi:hypothetical protein